MMMGRSGGITLLKVHTAHNLQVLYCKCVWKCDVCSEGVDPPLPDTPSLGTTPLCLRSLERLLL